MIAGRSSHARLFGLLSGSSTSSTRSLSSTTARWRRPRRPTGSTTHAYVWCATTVPRRFASEQRRHSRCSRRVGGVPRTTTISGRPTSSGSSSTRRASPDPGSSTPGPSGSTTSSAFSTVTSRRIPSRSHRPAPPLERRLGRLLQRPRANGARAGPRGIRRGAVPTRRLGSLDSACAVCTAARVDDVLVGLVVHGGACFSSTAATSSPSSSASARSIVRPPSASGRPDRARFARWVAAGHRGRAGDGRLRGRMSAGRRTGELAVPPVRSSGRPPRGPAARARGACASPGDRWRSAGLARRLPLSPSRRTSTSCPAKRGSRRPVRCASGAAGPPRRDGLASDP